MTGYDPNLPQEFAHKPKRRHRTAALIVAVVAVFIFAALFAALRHQEPPGQPPASSPEEASGVTPSAPVTGPAPAKDGAPPAP